MEFKDMLKYYRQNMGLSQRELAARLKLSPSTISMYEVGNREPDFETEEKIADFFNVDLNTLRGKDTEATPAPAAAPSLSSDRIDLLEKYDVLNDEGKAEAVRYIGMLGSVPTYTEEHADIKLNA
jgi:transcriptional regulator with XRE-family HTH domain